MGTARILACSDRVHPDPPDPVRQPFELDRHRIIESTAFRRLEGKTQVFAPAYHDHFRTRLTHTLEAAQIARTLAAALGADAGLAEAITLAHDLGHPPFGHAGEAALNEAMAGCGGFNHNAHSVRVVEYLEHPYPAFRGLNLTHATLTGLRAHCTRYDLPEPPPLPGGDSGRSPSVEADIASLADRIAYNCHDLEDAIGAEFVGSDDLSNLALWREAYDPVAAQWPDRSLHAVRRVVLDAMLNALLLDVVRVSASRNARASPGKEPTAAATVVTFSDAADAKLRPLEQLLIDRVYRRPEIAEMDARGRSMILALFEAYQQDPNRLPDRFAARVTAQGPQRVICDYIAGMTDRYCQNQCEKATGFRSR